MRAKNMNSLIIGGLNFIVTSTTVTAIIHQKTTNLGKSMQKSKTPRQRFLKNLKRGDKIWIVPVKFYSNALELTWQEVFSGWFDFNGANGKSCLLDCSYDGAFQFPTAHIFPTKKAAKLFAAPLKIKEIDKRLQELDKEKRALYKEWNKLDVLLK